MSAPNDTPFLPSPAPAAEGAAAAPEPSPGATEPKAGGSLPFDPLRLVAAVLRRWILIAASGCLLATIAGTVGYLKLATTYKATAQLMRQEPSASFRASELGEPFKPRQLSVQTLVGFMKSPAVLERVSEQTKLPARSIAGGLTVTPERNTDLITLTFMSKRSPQSAMQVLNAFGAEVVRLTREMQSQEASDVNRLLKTQLTRAEDDLRTMNRELLDFSKQAGIINADKEIDAYLRTLGDIDLRIETARIDYETLDLRITAIERELATNNPLSEKVLAARERLSALLQEYTPANPIVEEQKTALADLEAQLKVAATNPPTPPRPGEAGPAAAFYSELVGLRTHKEVTAAQLEKLKITRAEVDEKLRGLPEKGMALARIRARQQSLESAQALLVSRQREAQLYEDNAMGYYRFFEAKPEEVEIAGRTVKLVALTIAGLIFGALGAAAVVCLVESLDDRIKTAADLKRCAKLPMLATLPDLDRLDAVAQSSWAFRTWLALQSRLSSGAKGEVVCGFISAGPHEGRSAWIELLARAAGQREGAVIVVTNRPPSNLAPLPLDKALREPSSVLNLPGSVKWLAAPSDWLWNPEHRGLWRLATDHWIRCPGVVILVELTNSDLPETLLMAEELPQLIWLAGNGLARGGETSERLQTFQHAGCRFAGAVLNREVKLFGKP